MKRFFCLCGLLALLFIVAAVCDGQETTDWPGWRGLEQQGVTDQTGPLQWSAEENVAWKTEIPGEGHSSPVIASDRVFVTTAYPMTQAHGGRWALILISAALALLVAVLGVVHLRRLLMHDAVPSAVLLALFGGLFASETMHLILHVFWTDHFTGYYAWLDGHVVLGLACLLGMIVSPRTWRIGFGLLLLLLMASMVIFRPDPEYYGFLAKHADHTQTPSRLALFVLSSTGIVSLLAGIIAAVRRNSSTSADQGAQAIGPFRVVLVGLMFLLGLSAFGLWPFWYLLVVRGEASLVSAFPVSFSMIVVAMALAALIWCIFGLRFSTRHTSVVVTMCVFGLAVTTFVTANYARSRYTYGRAVICLDRHNGRILWTCEGLYGPKPNTHSDNSPATPTPVVADGFVYAYFGTPGLMCMDLKGNLQWENKNVDFEGIHGVAASLLASSGRVFVTSGNAKAPFISALDGRTGEAVWTTQLRSRPGVHGEHRTPLIVTEDGTEAILYWEWSPADLLAYDTSSGKELYRFATEIKNDGEAVASLLSDGRRLYLPCKSTFTAIAMPREDEELSIAWQTRLGSTGPNTSSPVLAHGLLFMVSDGGIATCLDAETGDKCWKERLAKGRYLASPVVMRDRVYFWNIDGVTTVVACSNEFSKLAENKLPEGIYASPAPSSRQLIIRTTSHLWCIDEDDSP